jgi:hypothetical protein
MIEQESPEPTDPRVRPSNSSVMPIRRQVDEGITDFQPVSVPTSALEMAP